MGLGVLAFLFTSPPFFNRQTTLNVNWPAIWFVGAPIAVAAAIWLLVYWFKPRDLRPPPHWNLKQDSPGTWVLVGISIAVLAALTALFATYRIGLIGAQLLPGNSSLVPATVTGYQKLTGRRRLCNAVATFSVDWGEDVRTCVDPATYGALVSRDLRIGEAVRLEITTNLAGTTLTAVQLSEQVAGTG